MIPVTTVLKIKYKQGFKTECLQWMKETASIASLFDGFIKKEIYQSAELERELVNIFTFKDIQHLQIWENSDERIMQTQKSKIFVDEISSKVKMTGLEFMFPTNTSPKKWKMVVLTVCVLFILLNTVVPVIQELFTRFNLPFLLKSLLGVIIMVSLMTFLILPFLSKIFSRWLVS